MSNIDKRALREAAEKATKGQWAVEFDDEVYSTDGVNNEQIAMVFSENEVRDAAFIAAANPATVLALLDELEAAAKRIAELEARTVTLPENITSANAPEVFEISSEAERLGLRGTYASYAVGCNARGIADEEALREAGVKVAAAGKGDAS